MVVLKVENESVIGGARKLLTSEQCRSVINRRSDLLKKLLDR